MRHIDFEKKRPARWPWAVGVMVLAAAGWGITTLLTPPPEPAPPAIDSAASDTLPPTAVPAPPDVSAGDLPRPGRTSAAAPDSARPGTGSGSDSTPEN